MWYNLTWKPWATLSWFAQEVPSRYWELLCFSGTFKTSVVLLGVYCVTLGHLGTQFGNHGSEPLHVLFPLLEYFSSHPSALSADMMTPRRFPEPLRLSSGALLHAPLAHSVLNPTTESLCSVILSWLIFLCSGLSVPRRKGTVYSCYHSADAL